MMQPKTPRPHTAAPPAPRRRGNCAGAALVGGAALRRAAAAVPSALQERRRDGRGDAPAALCGRRDQRDARRAAPAQNRRKVSAGAARPL